MQFIRFEAELKSQLEALYSEWRRSHRKEAGEVLTFFQEAEGTPIGTTLSRAYAPEFIAVLKARKFPFRVE